MAATDLPGLADIAAWGHQLDIVDIGLTVSRAQRLMQTDPVSVRAGGGQLATIAGGLDTGQQDLSRAGTGVLAGWQGESADAFGPHHAGLVNQVSDTKAATGELSTLLENFASVFEDSQRTVVSATGVATIALRMLRV